MDQNMLPLGCVTLRSPLVFMGYGFKGVERPLRSRVGLSDENFGSSPNLSICIRGRNKYWVDVAYWHPLDEHDLIRKFSRQWENKKIRSEYDKTLKLCFDLQSQ
jgi:hypothetical protein